TLAGCDAGTPPAAKVGQVEISRDTLRQDLEAEAARADAIHSDNSPAKSVDHTWSASSAAELLGSRIRYELLGLALKANHITVADSDRSSAEQSLCSSGGTTTQQTGCPGLKGYPKAYRTFQIELAARGSAYQKFLAADEGSARKKYTALKASNPDQLEVQCYVGATITDPSTVNTIQLRVAGGQSFASAVKAVSGAAVQGGKQCLPSSVLPKEVTSAKNGSVLGPYSNQSGGQFVVQILERRTGTYAEVSDLLKQQITSKQQQDAVQKLLDSAKVIVDPRYGHWDRGTGTVVPPKGPSSASSTTTVPAGSSTSG
ncbi:MAG: hypothetical protein JO291_07080, partial [Acidimicrobiia bacterium]|nr:hypothetical protein [Acidimicrobiia bacterium]